MIPLWIRIMHWVIAVLFLLLTLTGITQHFATVDFSIMDYSLATTIHEVGGIILSIVYVVFLAGLFITGYWRKYFPRGKRIRRGAWQQASFRGRNPVTVFLIVPLIAATGLYYYFPEYAPEVVSGFDGLWTVAMSHYFVSIFGVAYTIGHIFMAFTAGGLYKLQMMIYGEMKKPRRKARKLH